MIKLLIPISFFFTANFALSQAPPQKEIKKIIKDSANYFQHFKSTFNRMLSWDSVYQSNTTISGTKENTIITSYYNKDSSLIMSSYSATIADSLKQKQGKKIIDEWKDVLTGLFGDNIETILHLTKPTPKAIYGWTLNRGQFWVDIFLYKSDSNPETCVIYLNLTCYGPTWRRSKENHSAYKFK